MKKAEYKIGILHGIADKEEKAKFIGLEARKEYKQKQIESLENEQIELENQIQNIQNEIENLDQKISKIEEEYKNFPTKDELENAYSLLRTNIIRLEAIKAKCRKTRKCINRKTRKIKTSKRRNKGRNFKIKIQCNVRCVYTKFRIGKRI